MKHLIVILFLSSILRISFGQDIYVRINQNGYKPGEKVSAIILSKKKLNGTFVIQNDEKEQKIKPQRIEKGLWGNFDYQYELNFTAGPSGVYEFLYSDEIVSEIIITKKPYSPYLNDLVTFMQQQRCGYNPYFGVVCHQNDGKLFYSPVPDSTFYDFSGGWHDAGDQLKYLITSSNATARMLMAYQMAPEKFVDSVDHLGHGFPNEIPDVLDEAKWGLDWLLKLHPREDWLIHQVADDRDHRGFKFPHLDNANYGWGENSYRAAYFATGEPQGLGEWKSEATGIANLAGRTAAALALGAQVWQNLDESFALKLKKAAKELYEMGRKQPGFQQGNSFGAPYRYGENSWEDDMEWAGAELFKLTAESRYLNEAIEYAYMIKDDGALARDSIAHYEKYPFMNMGHFSLHEVAPDTVKTQLEKWYKSNLDKIEERAKRNVYRIGTPFIWCSNNLMVNYITQAILYEKMSGDKTYRESMHRHRDWLLGRNPWGTSMYTGIPIGGEVPDNVHLPSVALINDTPNGGLIDGPIYQSIYKSLLGLTLKNPDEFAEFQNDYVTYHDDIGDYSTNEPTMDGTADSILMWVLIDQ
ncbi:glycoside hydrolase family 9 protein [Algoriphagus sediminis]|uniref:Glycoside hydrolase family 9 protein n=1 Tax=Algoriphagus sediminis TaxID=3057113 RepID=A0ABT7YDF1_9BACT|nr:glycoside hydrolase family 9 protein [Algoriphagus sediminis]MDN3204549.1 glycoside hydrolase family 9 protein [Algoriphagus sediminis]